MDGEQSRNVRLWAYLVVCCLVFTGVCLLWLDDPIARWVKTGDLGDEIDDLLDAAEHFGTPFGQGLTLLTILVVLGGRFPQGVRIFCGATAAGLSSNVVKLFIGRTRPRAFDFDLYGAWDSFTEFSILHWGQSRFQSFPSSHTASAFGFAVLMSWAFPTGRPAFFVLATLTALHRISSSAHFPSDVCFGAAVGWIVGTLFVSWPRLSAVFDSLEQRWINCLDQHSGRRLKAETELGDQSPTRHVA